MSQQPFLDIHAIMQQLPHRYPFLLVDRVLECKPGESLTALKNVTINEPFFPGHFPQRPVMPGVLILEAMAQATGLLAFASLGHAPAKDEIYYFVGIDKARFREPVEPGDQILFKVKVLASKRGIWKFSGVAEVDGRVAAEAELMCAARKLE
ncbi:MAG TPA: 3-hydroxyacyl-ACP dehydratase FabZ [Gammaproteobacteria bacterium]|nr:3-hydroxyacyl-ACP dehydratase FabZ [Gammaproteobacteria bacterium]